MVARPKEDLDSSAKRAGANHILRSLPEKEYETLLPKLERVTLPQKRVLYASGAAILEGYFVNEGLISSLTVMQNGDSVEVGIVGDEGFVGLPILLNIKDDISRLTEATVTPENENGLELFYDFAITPAIRVIPSYQHIWNPLTAAVVKNDRGADVFLVRWSLTW